MLIRLDSPLSLTKVVDIISDLVTEVRIKVNEFGMSITAMDPANISPVVVWLGSKESKDVTGRIFEIAGGSISVADGWREGPKIDKGKKWEPADVGSAIRDLIGQAVPPQKVYGA